MRLFGIIDTEERSAYKVTKPRLPSGDFDQVRHVFVLAAILLRLSKSNYYDIFPMMNGCPENLLHYTPKSLLQSTSTLSSSTAKREVYMKAETETKRINP